MKESFKKKYDFSGYQVLHVADIEEILKILHEFNYIFNKPLSDQIDDLESYAHKLAKNAIIFAARKDKILGFIAFYANDNKYKMAYITLIAVQPFAQKKGIGKKLLNLCISFARNCGMKSIKLEVHNDNTKAINFYKKNGFEFYRKASAYSMYMIKTLI